MELSSKEYKLVNQVVKKFKILGCFAVVHKITDGLINETYKISTPDLNVPDYILQKINTEIFPDIEGLTENKVLVSRVLKDEGVGLEFIPTLEGEYFHTDENGESWQACIYIPDSQTLSKPIDVNIAFEAGKAIGSFHQKTCGIDVASLNITIPNFHNINRRFKDFEATVKKDPFNRLKESQEEVNFINKHVPALAYIDKWIDEGKLPKRLVHYDTKLSNVLFDQQQKAICLIDYDTIMSGTWLFDFGDAVRSICNTCEEDEKDIRKVLFDIELFEALRNGYLSEVDGAITNIEKQNLLVGAQYIILEQALRFLKDYLEGDRYYKTNYPEHNLQRTKVQLKLYSSLFESNIR